MFRLNIAWTRSASSNRSSPLLTKMQVSWSPMARCNSAAVTVESTPPDRAQITLRSPTFSRTRSIASVKKFPGVQVPWHWHIRIRKFSRIAVPRGVWLTSGWNWRPNILSPTPMAATGEFSVKARVLESGGRKSTRSPWLIQTWNDGGRPWKSGPAGGFW